MKTLSIPIHSKQATRTTNPKLETRKVVAESAVTAISGQPTNQDLDRLEDEVLEIA